jgi:hypothetical protein
MNSSLQGRGPVALPSWKYYSSSFTVSTALCRLAIETQLSDGDTWSVDHQRNAGGAHAQAFSVAIRVTPPTCTRRTSGIYCTVTTTLTNLFLFGNNARVGQTKLGKFTDLTHTPRHPASHSTATQKPMPCLEDLGHLRNRACDSH